MAHLKDARKELMDQLLFVLDHSMTLKKDGVDPMIPFSSIVKGENKVLKTFVADTLDYAQKMFEKTINDEDPDIAVMASDTYLTIGGEKSDAVLIKAYDKQDNNIYIVGQRFKPKSSTMDFEIIGNPAFLGTEDNNLRPKGDEKKKDAGKKKWKLW
ncbi:hypothetical protein [Cesiribacter sp. SM1]|uniref:hypothetical protein n=1 Tax=Cesiribacter sp. SM1 TaxID=2861196 RepID=UPI001CD1EA26|nr:hypothetical protein [Cesiribacter sp. SM1]